MLRRAAMMLSRLGLATFVAAWMTAACGADPAPAPRADAAFTEASVDASPADASPTGDAADGEAPAPVAVPFRIRFGVPVVDVRVDDAEPVAAMVDTGAPAIFLNDGVVAVGDVARAPPSLRVVGAALPNAPVLLGDPFGFGANVPVVLGAPALLGASHTFDFRASVWTLGGAPRPADTEDAETAVPFRLEGGGLRVFPQRQSVRLPATRLVVTARVEGRPLRLLVDTGAGAIVLRRAAFDAVASDGRAQVSVRITTQSGVSAQPIARVRSVAVGGAEVTNVAVSAFPDEVLDAIAGKVGGPVDGLLGVTFLREFAVTLDYPAGRLGLRRYTRRDHVLDEYRRVGLTLSRDVVGRYRVASVYRGTDADRQGVAVGETVESVAGRVLASAGDVDVDALLRGAPGETRAVRVGGRDLTLRVEELLPLP